MEHEPIQARRTGIFARSRKWIRRNPTLAMLLLSLVSLAAVLGSTLWNRLPERPPAGIAVLPFENLGSDKEDGLFTDGVQNEILTTLAKIADLKVISRTSVMDYRGQRNTRKIGQALHVSYLLEGSVSRAGGRIRLNTELVDTRTDTNVWAKRYERDLTDVFAVQSEIAQTIAAQLHAKLLPGEKAAMEEPPTRDLLAYDLYVRASALIDPVIDSSEFNEDGVRGIEFLNKAIARDPAFLLAYCKLAQAHDFLYFQGDRAPEHLTLADSALKSALRLRPDSGEAHLSLALHFYWEQFDYDRALAELAIASHTLPNNARIAQVTGLIARRQGRWSDAVRELKRSVELDPRNTSALSPLSITYLLLRSYPEARAMVDRMLVLDPSDDGALGLSAWIPLWERADTRAVQVRVDKLRANNPRSGFWFALLERDLDAADRTLAARDKKSVIKQGPNGSIELSYSFALGLIAHLKGNAEEARAAFVAARAQQEEMLRKQPPDYTPPLAVGLTDVFLGRKQDALREGRRAVELLPVAKNALEGADVLWAFAIICAWAGERDLAFEQLDILVKIPAGPSYGDLRLDPFWDPLRSDPRFDKIVASLASKEIVSK